MSCVQLREKNLGSREFLAQALMLKKLLAPHGVPLVIIDLSVKDDSIFRGKSL